MQRLALWLLFLSSGAATAACVDAPAHDDSPPQAAIAARQAAGHPPGGIDPHDTPGTGWPGDGNPPGILPSPDPQATSPGDIDGDGGSSGTGWPGDGNPPGTPPPPDIHTSISPGGIDPRGGTAGTGWPGDGNPPGILPSPDPQAISPRIARRPAVGARSTHSPSSESAATSPGDVDGDGGSTNPGTTGYGGQPGTPPAP